MRAEPEGHSGRFVVMSLSFSGSTLPLPPGLQVLMPAGSGGVGLAATPIALSKGCSVLATAGSSLKRTAVRGLGAPIVGDSRTVGCTNLVASATRGVGVDVLLNSLTSPGL